MTQLDPRLVEIEILTAADRALVAGGPSYQYRKLTPSGAEGRQRDEAVLGLMSERAIVAAIPFRASKNYPATPDPNHPTPDFVLDQAAAVAVANFLAAGSILELKITQVGRLRLFRLRDEILQRDRIRDDFNVLWAARHFLPDLEVRLRFRDPNEPLSLILLDVDKLKTINDELGHPGANMVLTEIFEILRDVVRPNDAYRLGGDEAGAILPKVGLADAKKLGDEIRRAVEARAWPSLEIKTRPTVSVGVGTYAAEGPIEPTALYQAVDRVQARAKDYRNRVEAAEVPEGT